MNKKNIGFELIALGHLLKRERDRVDEEIKKTVLGEDSDVVCSDLRIVKFLADNTEHEIYQKDIERNFSLTAPSVSNKLKDLQKNGFVERVYSKVDTRKKQVILTDQAIEFDKQMREEMELFESRIENILSKNDKELLFEIIRKVKREFE
jgi:DNA-binding MarR family transcriptional regulator